MMQIFEDKNGRAFCLQPLKPEEAEEARLLCDGCVGENLYPKEEIAAAIGAPDRFFYLLKTAEGETAGYIYYYLTGLDEIARYAKLSPALLQKVYPKPGRKVGKIQSVGLKAPYRALGLAAPMMRFSLGELRTLGAEAAFIVCWKPGGKLPLGRALESCRFRHLAQSQKVWYDDTDLICPYCKGRCLCGASVYYKILQEVKP